LIGILEVQNAILFLTAILKKNQFYFLNHKILTDLSTKIKQGERKDMRSRSIKKIPTE
jgi:hypothetical protein